MVKHIVLWKLRDSADKQKNMDRMISELTALVGKIEGLVSMEMGYNFNTDSEFDVVLYATFKNAAALKYYQTHPEHLKCKEFIHSVITGRTAADYFFEEGTVNSRPANEVPDAPEKRSAPVITITRDESAPKPAKPAAPAAPVAEPVKPAAPVVSAPAPAPAKPAVPAAPVAEPVKPAAPAAAPAPAAPAKDEKLPGFMKKKVEVEVTPLDQRSDTWTCPACGKIMPKYVGTCGCGEPQPFGFDDLPPALQPDPTIPQVRGATSAHASQPKPTTNAAPAAPAAPAAAPAPAAPAKDEKLPGFMKKKVEVEVTPLDQRSDTWTCPACGKIMPKYVGTCGCGEPQPFGFDDLPPALQPDPTVPQVRGATSAHASQPKPTTNTAPAAPAAPTAAPAPAAPAKDEKLPGFMKKKVEVEVTPLDQRSDTWTCPACGKIMPKYVGTCGCGEPQPFGFDDLPPALQPDPTVPQVRGATSAHASQPKPTTHTAPAAPAAPAAAPAPAAPAKEEHLPGFMKKKVEVEVTPLDQRSDTWTCPACGKIMPKYVGTCGCGEPQPFGFDDLPPALQPDPTIPQVRGATSAHASQPKPTTNSAPAAPAAPAAAPAPAAPAKDEKLPGFMKKKVEVEVTPLDQRSDTWTCPACGKIMPKYVGTCGCGEPQPFGFDDLPPALQPDPTVPQVRGATSAHASQPKPTTNSAPAAPAAPAAAPAAPAAAPAPATPAKEEHLPGFMKKKVEVEVTPLDQRSDTWTCPACGKIMPKYVGTCGCGEPQPFGFDDLPPALQPDPTVPQVRGATSAHASQPKPTTSAASPARAATPPSRPAPQPMPEVGRDNNEEREDNRITDDSEFYDAAPSIQNYSPQTTPKTDVDGPQPGLEFIRNDRKPGTKPFGAAASQAPAEPDYSQPMNFDDAPPPAPMRFTEQEQEDEDFASRFNFDDVPPPAPMRFDDAPPPAPMRFSDMPPAEQSPAPQKPQAAPAPQPKPEKKHLFGKKARESEALRRAEEVVSNRRDVPDIGSTWTCPSCGKVMPKYVGTCGCGEPQPFEV